MLRRWDELPDFMKVDEVKPYWEELNRKKVQLQVKRVFDFLMASILLIVLLIPMTIIAIMIKVEDSGPIFYRQERVTQYGRHFKIHKFRTMVVNADKIGTAVTTKEDKRITKVGRKLRGLRLDELPQVIDVLVGNMSFVGTRPEAVKYVNNYKSEYMATLLLPAGITSEASVKFKNEDQLLDTVGNVEQIYLNEILPQKMKWNLMGIMYFSLRRELKILIWTCLAMLGKE